LQNYNIFNNKLLNLLLKSKKLTLFKDILVMKHKCKPGSPASVLMRGHHASGGETMSRDMGGEIAPRRVVPNMDRKFKKGGHCVEYDREEHLERSSRKKNGMSSKRKPREHHFLGALAGALLPGLISPVTDVIGNGVRKLGHLIGLKEGGRAGKKKEHHVWGGPTGTQSCTLGSEKFRTQPYVAKKAMGGVGKTRKNYPMT
jgi:hypothetical protein